MSITAIYPNGTYSGNSTGHHTILSQDEYEASESISFISTLDSESDSSNTLMDKITVSSSKTSLGVSFFIER